jgi:hypothetical protein
LSYNRPVRKDAVMISRQHSDMAMSRFDTLLWHLVESGQQLGSLSALVRQADAIPHEPVTIETLITDGANPLEVLRRGGTTTHTELRTTGLVGVLLVHDDSGPFVISAWPTQFSGVFHLLSSIPSTDARWRKVERWIGRSSPHLVPCFLDHDDFADIGTALSEFGEVEVSRLTARRRSDMSSLTRGWKARASTLRPTHHEAIADAEEERASVRTLTLQVSGDHAALSLHLRRLAGATFYNGDFAIFEEVVLGRLATAAGRRAELLSGRQRRVDEPLPQPIAIRLHGPILADANATGEVVAELERMSGISIAVLHRNPYLHVVVTDYADGSNFDVLVTTPDVIEVYPGFRSSMGSYTRLTQRLGERFEALDIVEAAESAPVSLDDLVSST